MYKVFQTYNKLEPLILIIKQHYSIDKIYTIKRKNLLIKTIKLTKTINSNTKCIPISTKNNNKEEMMKYVCSVATYLNDKNRSTKSQSSATT